MAEKILSFLFMKIRNMFHMAERLADFVFPQMIFLLVKSTAEHL